MAPIDGSEDLFELLVNSPDAVQRLAQTVYSAGPATPDTDHKVRI